MAYTSRQWLYVKFMMKKIGFTNDEIISVYLRHHEKIYSTWYTTTNKYGVEQRHYDISNCIEMLKDEIELKKNKKNIKLKEITDNRFAATDLSNFVYCPVSYSIGKTFEITNPSGQLYTEIGLKLHEQLRLLNKQVPYYLKEDNYYSDDEVAENELIKKIKQSEIIFAGHTNKQKVFVNREENFVGQPDYIFRDKEGKYFVVEEKFHYLKSKNHVSWEEQPNLYESLTNKFFDNHRIQLISYVKNIKDYPISYGYLIYWYYDMNEVRIASAKYEDMPQIHDIRIKKIVLNQPELEFYDSTKYKINDLLKNKGQIFDKGNLNPNKCAACVVSKYCSHKSGRLNNYSLPHSLSDINLYYAKYPTE